MKQHCMAKNMLISDIGLIRKSGTNKGKTAIYEFQYPSNPRLRISENPDKKVHEVRRLPVLKNQ